MLPVLDALTRLYEATHHAAKAKVMGRLQPKLEKALATAFRAQGKEFVKAFAKIKDRFTAVNEARQLREVITIEDVDSVFDDFEDNTLELFLKPLTPAIKAALLAAGKNQIAELGMKIAFDLKNPRAVAYLKAHGAEMVSKINQTTREYIKTIITQAADEGWSYDEVARAIISKYEEFAVGVPGKFESRAQRIAVTELGNAYEEGNFEPIQDLMDAGLEMEKYWDTAPELSKTGPCPEICQPNNDQGWIPADEPFQSGAMTPLGHPGCYCDCYYRLVKE